MEGVRIIPLMEFRPVRGARMWQAPRSGGTRLHAGVDLSERPGTPVYAPEDARVVAVELDQRRPWRGYAPVVFLEGDSGVWHVLSHLDGAELARRLDAGELELGARVEAGDELATIGREAHVHWEVRLRPQPVLWTDPLSLQRRRQTIAEISADPLAWQEGHIVPFVQTLRSSARPSSPRRVAPRAEPRVRFHRDGLTVRVVLERARPDGAGHHHHTLMEREETRDSDGHSCS